MSCFHVSIDLWELREAGIYDVTPNELCSIFIEAIGHKDGNIVHPIVPGCRRQHDPPIVFGNLEKSLDPSPASDQTLFVKNEECIFYFFVAKDVVPRIHGEKDSTDAKSAVS